jgi:hypothetical protein
MRNLLSGSSHPADDNRSCGCVSILGGTVLILF